MTESSTPQADILVLSGYHTPSHAAWLAELQLSLAGFRLKVCTLPPRYFGWRLRGGPLSFRHWHNEALTGRYDAVIATSMVDILSLKGLYPHLASLPWLLYFHENQFCYPIDTNDANDPSKQARSHEAVDRQMVQLYSGIAATKLLFNSEFNRQSYLSGLKQLIAKLPDGIDRNLPEQLEQKSQTLPIPIDWQGLAAMQRTKNPLKRGKEPECGKEPIRIAWNHRVEYDKGIEELYDCVLELHRQQQPFRLILLGQRFRKAPKAWQRLVDEFGEFIEVDGFILERSEYLATLAKADVVLSTSRHEFQGLAFLEAIALGCIPLAPKCLVYPEYLQPDYLYEGGAKGMVAALSGLEPQLKKDPRDRKSPLRPSYKEKTSRAVHQRQWRQLLRLLS